MLKNNNESYSNQSEEEAIKIVYQKYPDSSLEEILSIYANREEWFKAMIKGIFYLKSTELSTENELEKEMKDTKESILNKMNFRLELE